MIDIETEIFNYIATALRSQYTNIFVASEKRRAPSRYPAVQIVEMSNVVSADTSDSGSLENHADLMYEVNVFSNLASGAKLQAKEIICFVDELFLEKGFVRQLLEPINNADASVYRYVARYIARVGKRDKVIYQR